MLMLMLTRMQMQMLRLIAAMEPRSQKPWPIMTWEVEVKAKSIDRTSRGDAMRPALWPTLDFRLYPKKKEKKRFSAKLLQCTAPGTARHVLLNNPSTCIYCPAIASTSCVVLSSTAHFIRLR
jgi:hypothetical protein